MQMLNSMQKNTMGIVTLPWSRRRRESIVTSRTAALKQIQANIITILLFIPILNISSIITHKLLLGKTIYVCDDRCIEITWNYIDKVT